MNPLRESTELRVGGIVLCGGHSRRMGFPKADLPFGDQPLLAHVAQVIAEVVSPIAIVSALGQPLPELSQLGCDVYHTHDRRESRGPLEGIAAGMAALEGKVDAVYVTACDVPRLSRDFVRHMIRQLRSGVEIAVPRCERFHHPLAAVYRMSVLPTIQRLLVDELLRPVYLFDELLTHEVSTESLRAIDADLVSLQNVNTPEQYLEALKQCGLGTEAVSEKLSQLFSRK